MERGLIWDYIFWETDMGWGAIVMAEFLAATAAVVFLHETVSVMSAAGIGLITAGIILVALG